MEAQSERREFLTQTIYWGLGLLGLSSARSLPILNAGASFHPLARLGSEEKAKSKIVISQNDRVRRSGDTFDESVLAHMINTALQTLTGTGSAGEAWRHFFTPSDTVGIKVNCLAGKGLSTHPELVKGIVDGLKSGGIKEKKIIIWDRLSEDLKRAGFKINTNGRGVRCYGTDASGADYEQRLTVIGSVGSRFSRILTRQCSAIINVPVLKDHSIAGISVSLKNLFGAIDNPNKYHQDGCDPFVADLYSAEAITSKIRLIICDALTAQYEGGPPYMPHWAWNFNGIIVGTDPVALDQVAYEIIDRKRKEEDLPSLAEAGKEPAYIATAADAQHQLGTKDLRRIDVIHV